MKKVTVGHTEPVAYVTVGKHRLKQYNNSTVYLRNGDEFELELFNPTTNKVMAKIELNGNSLGAGIVLRPGERVFIERYLEEARKFAFSTYEVNGNSEEVKHAIAKNGDVTVLFYKEYVPLPHPTYWTTSWPIYGNGTITTNTRGFGGSTLTTSGIGGATYSSDIVGATASAMYSQSMSMDDGNELGFASMDALDFMPTPEPIKSMGFNKKLSSSKSIETGRIDKGSVSDQTFGHDYSTFDTFYSWETKWKILPLSQKPLMSEDIKVFCTKCGTRQRKSSHVFCPNCGTKY